MGLGLPGPAADPPGAAALFNVPADADDTALAIIMQYLTARRDPASGVAVDTGAGHVAEFRDTGRTHQDVHNCWIEPDTGAF